MREAWELASFVVTALGLPLMLRGEDPEFQQYLLRVAQEERGTPLATL